MLAFLTSSHVCKNLHLKSESRRQGRRRKWRRLGRAGQSWISCIPSLCLSLYLFLFVSRYHRQKIVEWLGDGSEELLQTEAVLQEDGKNYHAWQHRQWAIQTFKLWENELEFVDSLLMKDLRNNSAWNQRYFVISSTTGWTEEVIKDEMKLVKAARVCTFCISVCQLWYVAWARYAIKFIRKAPNNESSWNYLRGWALV